MARLLTLARQADPDPEWGDRLRDPELWQNSDAMRKMAAELQQRLTGETFKRGLRSQLLPLIANKLGQRHSEAEPLLRAGQSRYPEDFWLNYGLGEMLRERKPEEAVGFYRAALATRSEVATVHHEIGIARPDREERLRDRSRSSPGPLARGRRRRPLAARRR